MPRECTICAHPRREEIDAQICRNVMNSRVASEFGLTERQVRGHKQNHVQPAVEAAQAAREEQFIAEVASLRQEVHYPIMQKVLFMQDKLLQELEMASEPDERISIIKEFRGWNVEEAKLRGAYIQDKPNETAIANALRAYKVWADNNPTATPDQHLDAVRGIATYGKVDADLLMEKAGVQEIRGVQ